MGFTYAGNLGGAGAPVVRRLQIGEDCYVGQLVMTGMTGGLGGHVQIADAATEAFEDDTVILGAIAAVADNSRTYVASVSATAQYGDRSTYTTTQATIAANLGTKLTGGGEVDVILNIPMVTMFRAPLYNAAWGTALTTITTTSASSGGVVVAGTGSAITDIADDFATVYCRTGANRGHSRIITTSTSTTSQTVTVPFPYGIAIGDTFVVASCVLGFGGLNFPASADCIDGNDDMNAYYNVYYHDINLEESGKEYAIFSFMPGGIEAIST
jgi:hypothetical protein